MAHKKAGGSSRNGRDSNAKRLGVKRYGGQLVAAGSIAYSQVEFLPLIQAAQNECLRAAATLAVRTGIGQQHAVSARQERRREAARAHAIVRHPVQDDDGVHVHRVFWRVPRPSPMLAWAGIFPDLPPIPRVPRPSPLLAWVGIFPNHLPASPPARPSAAPFRSSSPGPSGTSPPSASQRARRQ